MTEVCPTLMMPDLSCPQGHAILDASGRDEVVVCPLDREGMHRVTLLRKLSDLAIVAKDEQTYQVGATPEGFPGLTGADQAPPGEGPLVRNDRRLRAPLLPLFTKQAVVVRDGPKIDGLCREALAETPAVNGFVDFAEYSGKVMDKAVSVLYGVPMGLVPLLRRYSMAAFGLLDTPQARLEAQQAWHGPGSLPSRFAEMANAYRAKRRPQDLEEAAAKRALLDDRPLAEQIVDRLDISVQGLTDKETGLTLATTTNGFFATDPVTRRAMAVIASDPEIAAYCSAANTAEAWNAAIDSTYKDAGNNFPLLVPRTTTMPGRLPSGIELTPGDILVGVIRAAITSPGASPSLAFGLGPHRCLGTEQSRLLTQRIINNFYDEYTNARLRHSYNQLPWSGRVLSAPTHLHFAVGEQQQHPLSRERPDQRSCRSG